jgi:hypothetical protein
MSRSDFSVPSASNLMPEKLTSATEGRSSNDRQHIAIDLQAHVAEHAETEQGANGALSPCCRCTGPRIRNGSEANTVPGSMR